MSDEVIAEVTSAQGTLKPKDEAPNNLRGQRSGSRGPGMALGGRGGGPGGPRGNSTQGPYGGRGSSRGGGRGGGFGNRDGSQHRESGRGMLTTFPFTRQISQICNNHNIKRIADI